MNPIGNQPCQTHSPYFEAPPSPIANSSAGVRTHVLHVTNVIEATQEMHSWPFGAWFGAWPGVKVSS